MGALEINIFAVVAAAVSALVLGVLWYSPVLFRSVWMKVHGFAEGRILDFRRTNARAFTVTAVCYVVMAIMFSLLISYTRVTSAAGGLWLGFVVWLGFAFTIGLAGSIFSEKTVSAFLIDASYQLAYLLVMGAILGSWH